LRNDRAPAALHDELNNLYDLDLSNLSNLNNKSDIGDELLHILH
jgi:hypothetical protein